MDGGYAWIIAKQTSRNRRSRAQRESILDSSSLVDVGVWSCDVESWNKKTTLAVHRSVRRKRRKWRLNEHQSNSIIDLLTYARERVELRTLSFSLYYSVYESRTSKPWEILGESAHSLPLCGNSLLVMPAKSFSSDVRGRELILLCLCFDRTRSTSSPSCRSDLRGRSIAEYQIVINYPFGIEDSRTTKDLWLIKEFSSSQATRS